MDTLRTRQYIGDMERAENFLSLDAEFEPTSSEEKK